MGGVQEHHHEPMVELYDFLADKWRVMLPNPPTITFDFCCAVVKERLYKLGGFMGFLDFNVDKVPLMDVYNFRKHTWEKARQMDEMREAFACGVINDRIYVAGGLVRKPFLQENLRVRSAEVYIPETDSWESIPAMKECRSCCASAVVGQKLYVIGGYGTDSILRSVEVFDPAIKTWEFRAQTPASWIIAGCAAIGPLIYFVVSSALEMEAVAVYDTQTDEWYVKGVIPLESLLNGSKGSLWGCTVLASKGKLYVLGGASSCSSGGLKCGLVYDPTLETWSPLKMMRSRRHGCAEMQREMESISVAERIMDGEEEESARSCEKSGSHCQETLSIENRTIIDERRDTLQAKNSTFVNGWKPECRFSEYK